MKSATSADGTVIAYQQQGSGPALILVDGALSTRDGKAGLRALLAPHLTVFGYDRRGRGDGGDTLPYAVDRAGAKWRPEEALAGPIRTGPRPTSAWRRRRALCALSRAGWPSAGGRRR